MKNLISNGKNFIRSYKRIWQWNKRHAEDQKPVEVRPPALRRPRRRTAGNELWQELTREDDEWYKQREK
jgi:hypothetical protein